MSEQHVEAHAAPKHPYHLVNPSPWPILGASAAGLMFTGAILWMHGHGMILMIIGVICVLSIMFLWWRDVVREATYEGHHNPIVQLGLRYGMALKVCRDESDRSARRMFAFSLLYLFLIFSALLINHTGWH